MVKCKDYIVVNSLEEAYQLNQKKNNQIVAGNGWLKMSKNQKGTLIDLSNLGLDTIEETKDEFIIGAMTSLRDLELHKGLNEYTNNAIKEALENIVGTQFRNNVTIGGSIWSRFGFSDVLSIFLALDSYVELYNKKIISLSEFTKMEFDRDILVKLIVKKENINVAYESFRNQSTDFPILCVALAKSNEIYRVVIGATPYKASVINVNRIDLDEILSHFKFDTNMRASKVYRIELAKVLIRRALEKMGEKYEN